MRFGIKTVPQHTTWREMLDVWRTADDIELFESAWNWGHFYPLWGDLQGVNFEGRTMLGAMAAATRRIRIGCPVTGMIDRHPAVLANMAATVDHISNGRLDLGLGAGWNQQECDAYGIALPPLRDPAEITCSVNVRIDAAKGAGHAAEQAVVYRELGVDLVIVNLPQPFDSAFLEPLAQALAPLA